LPPRSLDLARYSSQLPPNLKIQPDVVLNHLQDFQMEVDIVLSHLQIFI